MNADALDSLVNVSEACPKSSLVSLSRYSLASISIAFVILDLLASIEASIDRALASIDRSRASIDRFIAAIIDKLSSLLSFSFFFVGNSEGSS
jgi:hypothetical protein